MNLSKVRDYFSPDMVKGKVHIIGCGSVGATLAENLVRCGVKDFVLWDFDEVEPHNLVNQIFRQKDIGAKKVDALDEILKEINPDINTELKPEGWKGENASGYIFLCVDDIELRKTIVEKHMSNPYVKAVFDFRTMLEGAQHYAADWSDFKMKQNFLNSMQFTHEEASEETPVSACGVTLGVATTVRMICAAGANNFINLLRGKPLKKMILLDAFNFTLDAF